MIRSIFPAVIGLVLFASQASAGPVTQTTAPASTNTCCWAQETIGTVVLAIGTTEISSLTSSVAAWDHGWGGYNPAANDVQLVLKAGSSWLWNAHVAGGLRGPGQYDAQFFDIDNTPSLVTSLGVALGAIDWDTTAPITVQMITHGVGYGGWELYVSDATFTVISQVPEPSVFALFALGLVGFGLRRRRA
ncbi:MAG: hypothetical protein ACI8Z1_001736 [Candidatus Azotimanducaceae bacterium]|jgi:hypothetical protein